MRKGLRYILVAAYLPLVCAAMEAQQPPSTPIKTTPTATTGQSALTENTKDVQRATDITNSAVAQNAAQQQQIADLQAKVAQLQDEFKNIPSTNIQQRLTALEKVQAAQQAVQSTQAQHLREALVTQYEAGYVGLSIMDDQANRLKFAFKLAGDVNNFQSDVNPMNNPLFTADVNTLLSKQTTKGVSSLLSTPAVQSLAAANPYVSLGVSIASYFTSKLHSSEKDPKLIQIGCIVNLATGSQSSIVEMQSDIDATTQAIDSFDSVTRNLFADYVKVVGFKGTIDDYHSSTNAGLPDPLNAKVLMALEGGGSATAPADLPAARTQIEQAARTQIERVQSDITQYDALIQSVGTLLNKFSSILSKQSATFDSATCAPNAKTAFSSLQTKVDQLKPQFDRGNWTFPTGQRAVILGLSQ